MEELNNRFDDNEELSEEVNDLSQTSDETEYESDETDAGEETVSETVEEDISDDDIFAVAEMITASRRYIPETDDIQFVGTGVIDTKDTGLSEGKPEKDPAALFNNFTPKKTVVTVLSSLITILILALCAVAAVNVSNDKVIRGADFDFIAGEEDILEAKERSEQNTVVSTHPSYDTVEDTEDPDKNPEDTDLTDEPQFKVTLDFYDRDDIELYSTKMTIDELLQASGITLLDGEELSVAGNTLIAAEATIAIDKYEYSSETLTESIPYETDRRETDLIPRGQVNYIQYGSEGVAEKTYTLKLKNGVEVARELVNTETTVYPTTEIYDIGVGGTVYGSNGKTYTYSYRKIVKATYYYLANDPYTYLGNHPDSTTIAVDPSVISLGTWVYVKNANYDFGLRQAQDIGSAVKGDMIDIWLDGSEPGYASFASIGIHYDMEVYFID